MGVVIEMLVPAMLEDIHGSFLPIELVAAKVASDETLCECVCELLDRRAVLRGRHVDLAERAVFERLTKKNASRFIRELRRRLSVELSNDSARILAAYVALGARPRAPSEPTKATVVIDFASWRAARGK